MQNKKILIAAAIVGMFALPLTVFAQANTNYRLGFSSSEVKLNANEQAQIEIVASGATDQNAAEIRVQANGAVRILGIQGNNEALSLGAETTDTTASIDVATTQDFEQEQSLASVVVALTGTGGGSLSLVEGSSIGGEEAQLGTIKISYSESGASNNPEVSPVYDTSIDPALLALIAVVALALLGLVVMVITRNRSKANN